MNVVKIPASLVAALAMGALASGCASWWAQDTCRSNSDCESPNVCVEGICQSPQQSSEGSDAGTMPDDAGTMPTGDAGTMPTGDAGTMPTGDAGFANDAGCTPESDEALCIAHNATCGSLTATDNCGTSRTVDNCGTCSGTGQSCGGGDTPNQCGCAPESDQALCTAHNATCGSLTATDNCGTSRTVDNCGTCSGTGDSCTAHQCSCTPESDDAFCLANGADCGSLTATDNCGTSRTVDNCGTCSGAGPSCGSGTSPNQCGNCAPETEAALCTADSAHCGSLTATDNCGATYTVSSCGTCSGTGVSCGGGGATNQCGCTPETDAALCAANGDTCGTPTLTDNCGTVRTPNCGTCTGTGATCGGGGTQYQCGCTPESDAQLCAANSDTCGTPTLTDNCGDSRTPNCGTCSGTGVTCGGGGTTYQCGCTPETDAAFCTAHNATCGSVTAANNCGTNVMVDCGDNVCTAPQTCGGGGTANQCGCTSESDAQLCATNDDTCGTPMLTDNCGVSRTPSCGTCSGTGVTCGGGGTTYQCGCTPESNTTFCAAHNATCGSVTAANNCGTNVMVDCGDNVCTAPQTCGGGSTPNQCGCTAESDAAFCAANNATCGSVTGTDNCGTSRAVADCGTCSSGDSCGGGGTTNQCGCAPSSETDAALCSSTGATCGTITVSICGSGTKTILCGECAPGDACGTSNTCEPVQTWADCDGSGTIDTPLLYNSANCGACGNDVDQYFPNGWGYCNDGVPELLRCHLAPLSSADENSTTGLLQGWAPNGAGTQCTACNSYLGGYDVPDNGIDENCDGVDVTNSATTGLYIDPINGNDTTGTGTPGNPFQSFTGVLNYWYNEPSVPAWQTQLFIAAGTLAAPLVWPNGADIIGSYIAGGPSSTSWKRSPPGTITTILQVSGTALDFTQTTPEDGATYVIDGVNFQVTSGTTRTGISYGGSDHIYMQNTSMLLNPTSSSSCYGIAQALGSPGSSDTGSPSLTLLSSSIQGNCWPLVATSFNYGGNNNQDYITSLTLYDVNDETSGSTSPQWRPAEARAQNLIIDSTIQNMQLDADDCGSTNSWDVEMSMIDLVQNGCSEDWNAYRSSLPDWGPGYNDAQFIDSTNTELYASCGADFKLTSGLAESTPQWCNAWNIDNTILDGYIFITSVNDSLILSPSNFQALTPTSAAITNNVFSGTGNPLLTESCGILSNNTFVDTSTTGTTRTLLETINGACTELYGNIFVAESSAGTSTGVIEQNANTEVLALEDNAFANLGTMFVHDGSTDVTLISVLNHLYSFASGNIDVSSFTGLDFTNPTGLDFSLQAGSPLIDASFNTSSATYGGVTTDFLGNPRPCPPNSGWDIGAYAYCQ